jgi:hypothetical protein
MLLSGNDSRETHMPVEAVDEIHDIEYVKLEQVSHRGSVR